MRQPAAGPPDSRQAAKRNSLSVLILDRATTGLGTRRLVTTLSAITQRQPGRGNRGTGCPRPHAVYPLLHWHAVLLRLRLPVDRRLRHSLPAAGSNISVSLRTRTSLRACFTWTTSRRAASTCSAKSAGPTWRASPLNGGTASRSGRADLGSPAAEPGERAPQAVRSGCCRTGQFGPRGHECSRRDRRSSRSLSRSGGHGVYDPGVRKRGPETSPPLTALTSGWPPPQWLPVPCRLPTSGPGRPAHGTFASARGWR